MTMDEKNMDEKSQEAKWYVIKVHSGFEQVVKFSILQAVDSLNLSDVIFEVVVPTEKQVRIKSGKRTEKEERIYPGYILVHMMLNDEVWYAINNIEYVSGFLGSRSHPESLSQEEVDVIKKRMYNDTVQHETDLTIGDMVKVTDGPFSDLDGKITEIDSDKGQVTVLIPMFGKETPVKLDLFQVRSI